MTQDHFEKITIYSEDSCYPVIVSLSEKEEVVNPNYDEQFERYTEEKKNWENRNLEVEAAIQTLKKHGITKL